MPVDFTSGDSLQASGDRRMMRETVSYRLMLLRFPWFIILIVSMIAGIGFFMLYSVDDSGYYLQNQLFRFAFSFVLVFIIAFMPTLLFFKATIPLYLVSILLLVIVEFFGSVGMGSKRWLDLGFMNVQPSEIAKVTTIMMLAYFYHVMPNGRTSRIMSIAGALLIMLLPAIFILKQPDLGTVVLMIGVGVVVMFIAGVSWWFFIGGGVVLTLLIGAVFIGYGTSWQLLKDYQYRRIFAFIDPDHDPLGSSYHVTQSKIAFGSGGVYGTGYREGTQNRLDFLPEKHTDFIFTVLAEELGMIGSISLMVLYMILTFFCIWPVYRCDNIYYRLVLTGLSTHFFLLVSINIAMVMGLLPVVGVPLPLVSYGGSSMLILMFTFGMIANLHVRIRAI